MMSASHAPQNIYPQGAVHSPGPVSNDVAACTVHLHSPPVDV